MRFLIIFIFLISNSFANDAINIKNIVINKDLKEYDNITFLDINKKTIKLEDFEGKLILLNFWATWCAPCKKEMPSLEKLAQNLPQVDVYPINMEPPNKLRVRDWLQDIGVVSLNTYFDPKLDLAKKFKLIGMPTTVLLDKDGNEFGRIMGEFDFSENNFLNFLKNKASL